MIRFLRRLIFFLIVITLLAYILDFSYTIIYKNADFNKARDKVSWLQSFEEPSVENYHYALFGSSRCIHHLNPIQIEKKTCQKGINLGYAGSGPFEIKLMVHEFLKKHNTKKIFIQLDNLYNEETTHKVATVFWFPYIRDDYLFNEIKKQDSLAIFYKNIPFYRYAKFESKLGLRNIFFSLFKENNFSELKGFKPMMKIASGDYSKTNYKLKDKSNEHLEEIKLWCREKGIDVYFFTAPYLNSEINTQVIANHQKDYKDFSMLYQNKKELFSDQVHLNYIGAEKFTDHFIEIYF